MRDAISTGLTRIRHQIPSELLEMAFQNNNPYYNPSLATIESRIRQEVIENLVKPELDITGGDIVTVDLSGLQHREINNAYVYNIPLSLTQGRHISTVLSVEMGLADTGPMQSGSDGLLNSAQPVQSTGTARAEVRGPNVVVVYDQVLTVNAFLRCQLENDGELANIPRSYHRDFGKLCVLAAQSYIYTELSLKLGSDAYIRGGVNSELKSIVDGYADAAELFYEELDTKWKKIMVIKNPINKIRLIRMAIGLPG